MIRLCATDDVADGAAKRFDVHGVRLALVRIGADYYAIGDRCSHADVSLSEGDVLVDSKEIECWKHGSAFSLETGEPSCLPALRPVPVYEVVVRDGSVFVSGQGIDMDQTDADTTGAEKTGAETAGVDEDGGA